MADNSPYQGFWRRALGVLLLLAVFGALGYQALFTHAGVPQ